MVVWNWSILSSRWLCVAPLFIISEVGQSADPKRLGSAFAGAIFCYCLDAMHVARFGEHPYNPHSASGKAKGYAKREGEMLS